MRIKKTLKIAAISLVILVILLLLFVTAFIYDPMEGTLPDMREAVPRNVDFFVRKTDLDRDFDGFPVPKFWSDIEARPSWDKLADGPWVRELDRDLGIQKSVQEIRGLLQRISDDSGGWVDFVDDVIGREVIIAGQFVPPTFEQAKFCAYTRVSWKVRFVWGLLGWSSVRERLIAGGLNVTQHDDETFTIQTGGQTYYAGRQLDCVMVANDQELLTRSLALATAGSGGGESFGGSSSYRDAIETRLRDWQTLREGTIVNALETYVRPDELFRLTKWDDNWPNARAPDDMNQRVLASFVNLSSWRFLSSSLVFAHKELNVLARIELNRNQHTGFQSEFFKAESAPYKDWLEPFLSMVPVDLAGTRGACAAAALRLNAADFLVEMYEALDDKSLIDDPLRKTGKYTGARDLIDKLRAVLLPRTGFVFMRARDLGLEVFEPSPAPHVAWVFWIRREAREMLHELRDFLTQNREAIGFTHVSDLTVRGLAEPCREFCSPHIPGTGEIALLLYGDFFILSNSSHLAQDMIRARFDSMSLLQSEQWSEFERELPTRLNGFVYLDGERLAEVFTDYIQFVGEQSQSPDASWMLANRQRLEQAVFDREFRRYGSIGQIPAGEQQRFERAVDAELDAEWVRQRASFTAGDRQRYEQLRSLSQLLDCGYVQLELDPQYLQFTSAFLLSDR